MVNSILLLRALLAVRRAIGVTVLSMLAACGGDGDKQASSKCPAGQVHLEVGCTDAELAAASVRTIVGDAMAEFGLRSALVSISVADEPLLLQAWGESRPGVPATTAMHFRSGAVAIPYMSTVLLQLEEARRLKRSNPLANWFTQYPNADRVTLEMLANNTSGYPDYVTILSPYVVADPFRRWTTPDLTEIAFSQPLICEPGTCFHYSHTNYVILSEVLSIAGQRDVADLIRTRVVQPLGLSNTRSDDTPAIPEPVLHAYDTERGIYEDATFWDPSWTLGRGTVMTSTIDDVRRSAIAIGAGTLLSTASQAALLKPVLLRPNTPALYYALGVLVSNGWVMQIPSFNGYSAVMAYLPERKLAIAVSSTNGPTTTEGKATHRLFLRIAAELSPSKAPILAPE